MGRNLFSFVLLGKETLYNLWS